MVKRLQVIVQEPEYRAIQRAARLRRMSIAEWVRQALVQARRREPSREVASKLEVIRAAARMDFPTGTGGPPTELEYQALQVVGDESLCPIHRGFIAMSGRQ
jgi:hypothetical protein